MSLKRIPKDYSKAIDSLPPLMTSEETEKENQRLRALLENKPTSTFIAELRANREFNNPENLQVKHLLNSSKESNKLLQDR